MARFFIHLGALGLVLLGIIDGPLFVPFGIDILLIVLVARTPQHAWLYVVCAAIGSTAGYLILDAFSRRKGEEGLRKTMSDEKFERVRKKMQKNAGRAVAVASMMPPPFPMTPVIAAAAAFQYPRRKLIPILSIARALRFGIVGFLAVRLGRRLIHIINAPAFRWFVIALFLVSAVGSGIVVFRWMKGRRRAGEPAPASA